MSKYINGFLAEHRNYDLGDVLKGVLFPFRAAFIISILLMMQGVKFMYSDRSRRS